MPTWTTLNGHIDSKLTETIDYETHHATHSIMKIITDYILKMHFTYAFVITARNRIHFWITYSFYGPFIHQTKGGFYVGNFNIWEANSVTVYLKLLYFAEKNTKTIKIITLVLLLSNSNSNTNSYRSLKLFISLFLV